MARLVPSAVATTQDRQADPCPRRACRHITVLRRRCLRTMLLRRCPRTADTRNIAIHLPAWTSTDRTERPQLAAATEPEPVPLREDTAPTDTAKVATAAPQSRPQATPPEPSTTLVTTTTVPERTTHGIRPDTRKTTASLTARRPTTAPSRPRPTPASSMTTGRRIPATTRKPTRRAMQRPISTLMVVITRESGDKHKKRKRERE